MHESMLGSRKTGYAWCAREMSWREEEKRFSEQSKASSLGADEDHNSVAENTSPWWVIIGKSLFLEFKLSFKNIYNWKYRVWQTFVKVLLTKIIEKRKKREETTESIKEFQLKLQKLETRTQNKISFHTEINNSKKTKRIR